MRLLLMGTGPFAVPSFEMLRRQGEEILTVISRPEIASKGNKSGPPPSPVRLWAESHGLPTASPPSINTEESIQWLKKFEPDLLFVCDYGQILKKEVLQTARLGGINLHGSLLPRYRGAAPVQWTILGGDPRAGVSVIHMTPGLDAGPILAAESTEVLPHEDAQELEARLSELGCEATSKAIELLANWNGESLAGLMQDSKAATKAPRLAKSDGQLDPRYPVRHIDRQIRGLQPWPGCYANLTSSSGAPLRLIVKKARPLSIDLACMNGSDGALSIGQVLYGSRLEGVKQDYPELKDVDLAVVAKDGLLILDLVQPAGKRPMTAAEFARGHAKQVRQRLEIPGDTHSLLERMIQLEAQG